MFKQRDFLADTSHVGALPPVRKYRAPRLRAPLAPFQGGIGPDVLITTDRGAMRAADITPGTLVMTREQGLRPVLWAGCERRLHPGGGHPAPVRLGRGALGGRPRCEQMLLAPGQHVLLRHRMNELFFAAPDLLCAARDLRDLPGVGRAGRQHAAQWVHLLFDGLALIDAAGLWLESMAPDMASLRIRFPQMAAAIEQAVPGLQFERGRAAYSRGHMVLNRKEVRMLGPDGYLT